MLRVAAVEPLGRFVVSMTLTDGSSRIVDLEPRLIGAMFQPLRDDPNLFRAVRVEHGTLAWPTGQDLDPDTLLDPGITERVASRWVRAMPCICQWDGIKIYVYGNDHNPPHIHAMYSGDEALIRIDSSRVFEGSIPRAQLHAVKKWMAQHRPLIALAWVQAQAGQAPDKVPPP